MIAFADISNTDTATLTKLHNHLQHMLDRRAGTVHNKRTKKLKIDFKSSGNGHFNKLLEAVKLELGKRNG